MSEKKIKDLEKRILLLEKKLKQQKPKQKKKRVSVKVKKSKKRRSRRKSIKVGNDRSVILTPSNEETVKKIKQEIKKELQKK